MKKGLATALAVVVFAGCATTGGKRVDQEALSSLKPGVTTIDEVKATFGAPFQDSKEPDGTEQLQYISRIKVPDDRVPTVGSNIPRTIEKNVSSLLVFDKSGHFLHAWEADKTVDENVPGNMGTMQAGDMTRGSMYSHGF